jgi:glycosyltransferase involved in cell wall biosynthesis
MQHREPQGGRRTFLFCSSIALYPPLLKVADIITRDYGLEGHVLAPQEVRVPAHPVTFWSCSPNDHYPPLTRLPVHFLPAQHDDVERWGFVPPLLTSLLEQLSPDYIWIHDEFWQGVAQQILWHYRFRRKPRLIAFVAINHIAQATPLFSGKYPFFSRTRLKQIFLWPRLDGVAACAGKSKECARRMGLPESVPVSVNYLPVFGPEEAAAEGIRLPWPKDGAFTIGFAGLLSEQKGWKVLLAALVGLPQRFKVVLAGDGEQREELLARLQRHSLQERVYWAGALPKDQLLATLPLFDVLILPSITTPHSVEQFGAVLAEAMACGVPVIGSDSGGIPEVVGEAGLIVPEGDPAALAQAILRAAEDEGWRQQTKSSGQERYRNHFSCKAYARSIATMLQIAP